MKIFRSVSSPDCEKQLRYCIGCNGYFDCDFFDIQDSDIRYCKRCTKDLQKKDKLLSFTDKDIEDLKLAFKRDSFEDRKKIPFPIPNECIIMKINDKTLVIYCYREFQTYSFSKGFSNGTDTYGWISSSGDGMSSFYTCTIKKDYNLDYKIVSLSNLHEVKHDDIVRSGYKSKPFYMLLEYNFLGIPTNKKSGN